MYTERHCILRVSLWIALFIYWGEDIKDITWSISRDHLKRNNGKHLLSGHYISCKWRDPSLLWLSINLETRSWLPSRNCIFILFPNVLVSYCWITNHPNIKAKSNKHPWSHSLCGCILAGCLSPKISHKFVIKFWSGLYFQEKTWQKGDLLPTLVM